MNFLVKNEYIIFYTMGNKSSVELFYKACIEGNLPKMKKYYSDKVDMHYSDDFILRRELITGNLVNLNWIWQKCEETGYPYDLHKDDDLYFISVKNSRVMRWLWYKSVEIGQPYDLHKNDDYLFRRSIIEHELSDLNWLWKKSIEIGHPFNLHKNNDEYFKLGNIQVMNWLWKKGIESGKPFDLHKDNDELMKMACYAPRFSKVQWLMRKAIEISQPYSLHTLDDSCRKYIRRTYNVHDPIRTNDTPTNDSNQQCSICLNNKRAVAFNCGHFGTCHRCAHNVALCPWCVEVITKRITIYLV